MKELIRIVRSSATAAGQAAILVLVIIGSIEILQGSALKVLTYWMGRIGFTAWVLFPAAAILISIVLLIFIRRIDERFPSLQELDLIIEGSLVAGLLGTTLAIVFGLQRLKAEEFSLSIIVGIVSEGLMSTGFGLAMSFFAWLVKKKLFPEEVKQRILLKKIRMQSDILSSMENRREENRKDTQGKD